MNAKLTVRGVRGALPVAEKSFSEYGGNTSCFSLDYGKGILCFDAGSGLSGLTGSLDETRRLDILISHVHLDHILGLVGLCALPGPEVHLYGEARQGISFRRQLDTVIGGPYWPVGLDTPPGRIQVHEIAPGDRILLPGEGNKDIRISTLRGNHPNESLLYRADIGGKSITYTLDCEMNEEIFPRLTDFARGSSLLIWDANFTREDMRKGWGHSCWEEGAALGRTAGAERILMTHYARGYTDSFLREQEKAACLEDNKCIFAREGMVIDL